MNNIDYITVVSNHFPGVEVFCYDGDPNVYEHIHWKDTPITKEVLDEKRIICYRVQKTQELSDQTKVVIESGFSSSALGAPHFYDAELEDQVNLIGVVASGTDSYYACREGGAGGPKSYKYHTIVQLMSVISDGKAIKLAALQNFAYKRYLVELATTIDEIANITL